MKFNVMKLKAVASRATGRSGLLLKKHSPEILLGVGVIGIVSSTVMACSATLKMNEVLDAHSEKIAKVHEALEVCADDYTQEEAKKDTAVIYIQTAVDVVKLYGPAVTLGVASIACILGSHNIMRRRNVALAAAYKAIENSFNKYRQRVIEEFGEQKDEDYRTGVRRETITETTIDENGKKVKIKKEQLISNPAGISEYARYFAKNQSTQWSPSAEYNMTFLMAQQNMFNDLLTTRGHVFLNEVYDALGFKHSTPGSVVGWVKNNPDGNGYVDFGIHQVDVAEFVNDHHCEYVGEERVDFVNGLRPSILLDFNVDGMIYDMI